MNFILKIFVASVVLPIGTNLYNAWLIIFYELAGDGYSDKVLKNQMGYGYEYVVMGPIDGVFCVLVSLAALLMWKATLVVVNKLPAYEG